MVARFRNCSRKNPFDPLVECGFRQDMRTDTRLERCLKVDVQVHAKSGTGFPVQLATFRIQEFRLTTGVRWFCCPGLQRT